MLRSGAIIYLAPHVDATDVDATDETTLYKL